MGGSQSVDGLRDRMSAPMSRAARNIADDSIRTFTNDKIERGGLEDRPLVLIAATVRGQNAASSFTRRDSDQGLVGSNDWWHD